MAKCADCYKAKVLRLETARGEERFWFCKQGHRHRNKADTVLRLALEPKGKEIGAERQCKDFDSMGR